MTESLSSAKPQVGADSPSSFSLDLELPTVSPTTDYQEHSYSLVSSDLSKHQSLSG